MKIKNIWFSIKKWFSEKKWNKEDFSLSELQINLIVLGTIFFIALLVTSEMLKSEKTNLPVTPPTPLCTTSTTISCSDANVIVTQDCVDGKLINTGKVCPCTKSTTISCSDGSVIVTQNCINGALINTGKVCPCTSPTKVSCWDGSVTITQDCIEGKLINTGRVCPTPPPTPAPLITPSDLQSIMQKCSQVTSIKGPKIKMQFHDNNMQYVGYTFFVGSQGQVSPFTDQEYDMWLTLNINEIQRLKASNNVCSDLKSIVQAGNAYVIEQSNNPFTLMKYMGLKPCVM